MIDPERPDQSPKIRKERMRISKYQLPGILRNVRVMAVLVLLGAPAAWAAEIRGAADVQSNRQRERQAPVDH